LIIFLKNKYEKEISNYNSSIDDIKNVVFFIKTLVPRLNKIPFLKDNYNIYPISLSFDLID